MGGTADAYRGSEIVREELRRRIDAIEEAYEFMLAYAAQGVSGDTRSQSAGQLRQLLGRAAAALDGLGDLLSNLMATERLQPAHAYGTFQQALDTDARRTHAAVELVLAQTAISSQLIDNLNASIHVRALLTDLFLIDELLKSGAVSSQTSRSEPLR
jgi:hypothetical protein